MASKRHKDFMALPAAEAGKSHICAYICLYWHKQIGLFVPIQTKLLFLQITCTIC